jgi:hypothetical protein
VKIIILICNFHDRLVMYQRCVERKMHNKKKVDATSIDVEP